jgi:hypothetical protein
MWYSSLYSWQTDQAKEQSDFCFAKKDKWIENYSRGNNIIRSDEVKALKQEIADLLEQDAKADKLRSLPLYSCRITDWKFVCSKCYDKAYNNLLVQSP